MWGNLCPCLTTPQTYRERRFFSRRRLAWPKYCRNFRPQTPSIQTYRLPTKAGGAFPYSNPVLRCSRMSRPGKDLGISHACLPLPLLSCGDYSQRQKSPSSNGSPGRLGMGARRQAHDGPKQFLVTGSFRPSYPRAQCAPHACCYVALKAK